MSQVIILEGSDYGTCWCCPFNRDYGWCNAANRELEVDVDYELEYDIKNGGKFHPRWCPIKDLPEKYDFPRNDYEEGWNNCLDRID